MNDAFSVNKQTLDSKQLRDYQVENQEEVIKAWETKQGGMLQMPTGTGKTLLVVSIINDLLKSARHDKLLRFDVIQMQNAAYKGTDFILFSNPKFFFDRRMAYGHWY